MRIVRWHPQERVDKPDLDAMSYLKLGEFRRTLRALVQGEDQFVITGFAVEPSAVPDTFIRVRLQPPGTERASALGSELTSAGLDKGQLIGDRDSSFFHEGAAQQTYDFAIQPIGSYTVEMRFVYADAVNDNRAFWNAGGAIEFISNVQTRTTPTWVLQVVAGAPSGGVWIPLATVAWNGAIVNAGDITDLRAFTWEGTAPFQQATQTGSGGVEDFPRATTRGAQATGLHRLRKFARGVLRQIQDIKGQDDAGQFNWFSRIFSPFDPADALGAQTKTMRTIDTVTYTVGDGVSTFGDFNGATGLDACLAHIDSFTALQMPERVEIVLHGGVTQVLSGSKILSGGGGNPLTIVIRAGETLAQANVGTLGRPRIDIDGATVPVSSFALAVSGSGLGSLVLQDLDVSWSGTTASGRGMFATTGGFIAERCTLSMGSPAVDAGFVISSRNARISAVRRCTIVGRVQMYNDDASTLVPVEEHGGVIEQSILTAAQIVLRADAPGVPGIDAVNGFAIRDCSITGRTTAIYTGSIALIDARCARKLHVERNTITYGINENAIDIRTYNGVSPFDVHVRGNRFVGGLTNGVAHVSGAGGSGAAGTGWAFSASDARNVHVEGNRYAISDSVDAGGVRFFDVEQYSIDDESHIFCGHGAAAAAQYEGILLSGTVQGTIFGSIDRVQFSEWLGGMTRVRCINLDFCSRLSIEGSTLLGQESGFGPALVPAAGFGAMRVDQIQDVRVSTSLFEKWANATANSRTIFITDTLQTFKVMGCSFLDCGGFSIVRTAGTPIAVMIDDCAHYTSDGANEDFADLRGCIAPRVTNCKGIVVAGGPNTFVSFNNANFLFMGNQAPNGDIDMNGAAVAGRGFQPDDTAQGWDQDLNLVNAYVP